MSAAPNKKPSVALGLILILLLLAAVVFGGMWVVQAAFTPRMSDARAAARGGFCPCPDACTADRACRTGAGAA